MTGGASGIGKSIAQGLSRDGNFVVVADINKQEGEAVAESVEGHFFETDLSERDSCRNLIDASLEKYERIDILINNGGLQHVAELEAFPEDKWDNMLKVMLTAPFLLTKYAWPSMKAQQWGRVINIASIHGLVASPNKAAYVSAKHGLIGLTRTAALEGGSHGITVNALCPSYVRTPLIENQIACQAKAHQIAEEEVIDEVLLKSAAIKKLVESDEVAELVCYLTSDKASAITGACWTIDCGWTAQ